jgi:hypothetical protein
VVELTRLIDVLESAGMALDQVEVPFEDEASSAGSDHADLVAGFEPGLFECLDRERRLMLRADASEAPTPFLYFLHWK